MKSFCPVDRLTRGSLECKVGYFFFTDTTMSEVYDQGGFDLQMAGSYPIYEFLRVYGSIEYLEKSGHSLNGNQQTSLWAIPLSIGLQSLCRVVDIGYYYCTIGPRYFFVQTHNKSNYVPSNMAASGCGGFANIGFLLTVTEHWSVDFFGECSYKQLTFHSSQKETFTTPAQVGGLTFGLSGHYTF